MAVVRGSASPGPAVSAVTLNLSGSGVDDTGEFVFPEALRPQHVFGGVARPAPGGRCVGGRRPGRGAAHEPGLLGHSRGGGIAVLHGPPTRGCGRWYMGRDLHRSSGGRVLRQRDAWRAAGVQPVKNRAHRPDPAAVSGRSRRYRAQLPRPSTSRPAAARITVPWLIVHGSEDEAVALLEGERLAARGAQGRSRFLAVEGAGPPHLRGGASLAGPRPPGSSSRCWTRPCRSFPRSSR